MAEAAALETPNLSAHFFANVVKPPAATSLRLSVPTLVIWGMKDEALLPLQLEGLDTLVDDLTIVRLPDAGHFAPWEAGGEVAAALQPFLAGQPAASAPAQ